MRWVLLVIVLTSVAMAWAADGDKTEQSTEKQESFPEKPKKAEQAPTDDQRKKVEALIQQLGAQEYSDRQSARKQLAEMGAVAVGQLRDAAETSKDAEVKSACRKLLGSSDIETWEGYYYYSLEKFDDAVGKGTSRVRFWLKVRRNENGEFTAEADEQDKSLGESTMSGSVDVKSGEFSFDKAYVNQGIRWRYEGKWNAEKGRVEGTYGPNSGGFVLYPRELSESERARFDAANMKK